MTVTQEVITSRKNPLVVLAAALNEKKYREEYGLFAVPGYKLYREALASKAPIVRVLISESYAAKHMQDLRADFCDAIYEKTVLTVLSDGCFEKISQEKAGDGIILHIKHLDISKKYNTIKDDAFFKGLGRAILLESIRDPGNLGTILRSAAAFGVDCVLLSADCADLYHVRTVRAAMGALFRLPTVRFDDSYELVTALRAAGRRVLAAELREGSVPLDKASLSSRDIVVIGNEGHGIPPALSAACDCGVYLPIHEEAESLNAAMAATVFLWEQSK